MNRLYHLWRHLAVSVGVLGYAATAAADCGGRFSQCLQLDELWIALGGGEFQSFESAAPGQARSAEGRRFRAQVLSSYSYRPLVLRVPSPGVAARALIAVGGYWSNQFAVSGAVAEGWRVGAVLPVGLTTAGHGLAPLRTPQDRGGRLGGLTDPRLHVAWRRELSQTTLLLTHQLALPLGDAVSRLSRGAVTYAPSVSLSTRLQGWDVAVAVGARLHRSSRLGNQLMGSVATTGLGVSHPLGPLSLSAESTAQLGLQRGYPPAGGIGDRRLIAGWLVALHYAAGRGRLDVGGGGALPLRAGTLDPPNPPLRATVGVTWAY